MTVITDSDKERLWEGIDALRRRGVALDDVLIEVGLCWVESHRDALRDAEQDARQRIFKPIRGG